MKKKLKVRSSKYPHTFVALISDAQREWLKAQRDQFDKSFAEIIRDMIDKEIEWSKSNENHNR